MPSPTLGIGKFIALDFARRGARVILACRSEARGSVALKEIREETGNPDVHLRLVDLSSLDSVREFAKGILEEEKALHILVNNAAVSGDTCAAEIESFVLKLHWAVLYFGDLNIQRDLTEFCSSLIYEM